MAKQLMTPWGECIGQIPLSEYPRPQMVRTSYLNLNGPWEYGIGASLGHGQIDGQIIVPFSPESALSSVNRQLQPNEWLYYRRSVTLDESFNQGVIYLHFEAIDQSAYVYVNQQLVGMHVGGFTPFSFDITNFVISNEFMLEVYVQDVTDTSYHQVGKQKLQPNGIFYTPQSGIWQTVWLESVPKKHIKHFKITPLYDDASFEFEIEKIGEGPITIEASFGNNREASVTSEDDCIILKVTNRHDWTPETPNLYEFSITFFQDHIQSYGALRLFEQVKDGKGNMRFHLNHQPYFLSGVLDQGYWPDGLLTPPNDKAYVYDITVMKNMGFNMIRKHIKIESLRFYHHCDRIGMIVMQDMISGGTKRSIVPNGALALAGIHVSDHHYRWFGRHDKLGREQYYKELNEMVQHLYSIPCIAAWVPFNEAWGQFDALEASRIIKSKDSTRLIDHASGWSDQGGGDFHSRHIYFTKIRFSNRAQKRRIVSLSEYGGYALKVTDHMFDPDKAFGYRLYNNQTALEEGLYSLWEHQLRKAIDKGLNVIVYTQLSDVENEVNGLITYDRKIVKVNIDIIRKLNADLQDKFKNSNS